MTWDVTVPADTDLIRLGAGVIRTLKTDLTAALTAEGIFPGSNPSAPVFRWTGLRGNTAGRPASPILNELYFNTDIPQLEYWNGSAWTQADVVPANGVTDAKIATSAVGSGLTGGGGSPISVVTDGSSIDVNGSNQVEVKAQGVSPAKLGAVAGGGLSGGSGVAISANPDDITLDLSGSAGNPIEIKAGGVTEREVNASALSATGALSGGSGTKLGVKVDGSTIQISGDQLAIIPAGVHGIKSFQTISNVSVGIASGASTNHTDTTISSVNTSQSILSVIAVTVASDASSNHLVPLVSVSLTGATTLRVTLNTTQNGAGGTITFNVSVMILEYY